MNSIFRHEFRLILREPRFWIPFLLPPAFLVGMQVFMVMKYGELGQQLSPTFLLLIGALLSTMAVSLTADSFAGERERNTLELLFCLPLTLRQIFLGKLLAVLPMPLVLAFLAQLLLWKLAGVESGVLLLQAWFYAASVCLVITGISLLISLYSPSVRSAAQTNVLFVFGFLILTKIISDDFFTNPVWPWAVLPLGIAVFLAFSSIGLRRFARTANLG